MIIISEFLNIEWIFLITSFFLFEILEIQIVYTSSKHIFPSIYYFTSIKELRNCILCIIPVWSLFCLVRVYKSLHFLPILLVKLGFVFLSFSFSCICISVFLFLYLCSFALSFEFNVLIDLITWYSQSGSIINHVLFKFVFTLFRSSHPKCFIQKAVLNHLMPGGNKKLTHTLTNLQMIPAGLFKCVWPFCYHQALKG